VQVDVTLKPVITGGGNGWAEKTQVKKGVSNGKKGPKRRTETQEDTEKHSGKQWEIRTPLRTEQSGVTQFPYVQAGSTLHKIKRMDV